MTKTCGNCGHAALDDQAQFCNRCGAAVPPESRPAFPTCPGCGTVVSDELAQFCNRCGAQIPRGPLVCTTCGSPAIDDQSRFCTRCGTTFRQPSAPAGRACPSCGSPDPTGYSDFCNRCGTPFASSRTAAASPGRVPVIVAQRKQAPSRAPVTVPDTDWEPWNDPAEPRQGDAPLPSTPPVSRDQHVSVIQKKYSHLPLVADELRKTSDKTQPSGSPAVHGITPKKRTGSQNKGVLGFLNK